MFDTFIASVRTAFRKWRSHRFPRPYGKTPEIGVIIARALAQGRGAEIRIDEGGYAYEVVPSANTFVTLERQIVVHPRPFRRISLEGHGGQINPDNPYSLDWSRRPWPQDKRVVPNTDPDLAAQSTAGPVVA